MMVEDLMENNEVIGLRWRDRDSDGNKIYRFLKINNFEQLQMDYTRSYSSPKNFFLPFKEDIASYDLGETDWEQQIQYTIHPRVIVGMRACDINALRKLDEVMVKSIYPNPYYFARRRNTVIIGLDHEPLEDCFCRSMGTDVAFKGFDLFLTDIGGKYFTAIGSDTSYMMVNRFGGQEVTDEDQRRYKQVKKEIESKFTTQVDVTFVPELVAGGMEEEQISKRAQMLVRAYDPCISCSVH